MHDAGRFARTIATCVAFALGAAVAGEADAGHELRVSNRFRRLRRSARRGCRRSGIRHCNDYSKANRFLRLVVPRGKNDFTDLTLIHSYRSYHISNDVAGGQPAATDLNEAQEDTFLNLQFRQSLGDSGSLSFGSALKISRIRDFGNPANDFASARHRMRRPAARTPIVRPRLRRESRPTARARFRRDDKTASDYRFQTDYVQRIGHHDIRAGGAYRYTDVGKTYAVTLRPDNYLAPLLTPGSPTAPATAVDDASNAETTYESYLQDRWKIGSTYQLDYG